MMNENCSTRMATFINMLRERGGIQAISGVTTASTMSTMEANVSKVNGTRWR